MFAIFVIYFFQAIIKILKFQTWLHVLLKKSLEVEKFKYELVLIFKTL